MVVDNLFDSRHFGAAGGYAFVENIEEDSVEASVCCVNNQPFANCNLRFTSVKKCFDDSQKIMKRLIFHYK